MALSDEEVSKMIYRLLDAAEGDHWQIEKMGPSLSFHRGLVQIGGERSLSAQTKEEVELMVEAFDRMENELFWIRNMSGVVFKVNETGRKAHKEWKQQMSRIQQLRLIGFSYSPDEYKTMDNWSNKHNAHILVQSEKSAFRDNVIQLVERNREANVEGFIIADSNSFKAGILAALYKAAKDKNFLLYAADRGDKPFSDDDFPAVESSVPTAGINYIHVHGHQNVIATNGGINQQIANHLEIIKSTQPEIADFLEQFTDAVRKAELAENERTQLLARIDVLSEEISRKPEHQHNWSILERAKGIVDYMIGLAALSHGVHSLMVYKEQLIPLISKVFGV